MRSNLVFLLISSRRGNCGSSRDRTFSRFFKTAPSGGGLRFHPSNTVRTRPLFREWTL